MREHGFVFYIVLLSSQDILADFANSPDCRGMLADSTAGYFSSAYFVPANALVGQTESPYWLAKWTQRRHCMGNGDHARVCGRQGWRACLEEQQRRPWLGWLCPPGPALPWARKGSMLLRSRRRKPACGSSRPRRQFGKCSCLAGPTFRPICHFHWTFKPFLWAADASRGGVVVVIGIQKTGGQRLAPHGIRGFTNKSQVLESVSPG